MYCIDQGRIFPATLTYRPTYNCTLASMHAAYARVLTCYCNCNIYMYAPWWLFFLQTPCGCRRCHYHWRSATYSHQYYCLRHRLLAFPSISGRSYMYVADNDIFCHRRAVVHDCMVGAPHMRSLPTLKNPLASDLNHNTHISLGNVGSHHSHGTWHVTAHGSIDSRIGPDKPITAAKTPARGAKSTWTSST